MNVKTSIKPNEIVRKWYVLDVSDMVLGRAATKIARILMGKNKAYYAPQWDMGDNIVVVNAEKVLLTGNKEQQKKYYRHSGYPGGLRTDSAAAIRKLHPTMLVEKAVKGMLPKNRLQSKMLKKLYIYAGAEHPHVAQKPEQITD